MEPDDLIELMGLIGLFVSAVFAVFKHVQDKKREFQKSFFDERLKTYSEAVEHAAAIVVFEKEDMEFQNAVANFKKLYWGRMCIVEDKNVEIRMVLFNDILDVYLQAKNESLRNEAKTAFEEFSLALAHTCRNSCKSTWKVSLNQDIYKRYANTLDEHEYIRSQLKLKLKLNQVND